jgi:hypothetical protein
LGEGKRVGTSVGRMLGTWDGLGEGAWVGGFVGRPVGPGELGSGVGSRLGCGVGAYHFPTGTPSPAADASALLAKLRGAPNAPAAATFQLLSTNVSPSGPEPGARNAHASVYSHAAPVPSTPGSPKLSATCPLLYLKREDSTHVQREIEMGTKRWRGKSTAAKGCTVWVQAS